jgi:hypothetical protein
MVGIPPSARQVSADPAMYAVDFSHRYAELLDYHIAHRISKFHCAPQLFRNYNSIYAASLMAISLSIDGADSVRPGNEISDNWDSSILVKPSESRLLIFESESAFSSPSSREKSWSSAVLIRSFNCTAR